MVRKTGQGVCEQEAGCEYTDPLSMQVVRGSVALSAAVQGTALPREEELCLQFMKEVEALVKRHRESK